MGAFTYSGANSESESNSSNDANNIEDEVASGYLLILSSGRETAVAEERTEGIGSVLLLGGIHLLVVEVEDEREGEREGGEGRE